MSSTGTNIFNAPKDNKESKPETKPTNTTTFGGLGIGTSFGNNFTNSGMFGTPKQNE